MDQRLEARLKKWHQQIDKLAELELNYLNLDASEKAFFAALFLKQEGKSIAEREYKVYALPEWAAFKDGLVIAKSGYNKERRVLELKMKAYEAEYITMKVEYDAIKK